MKCPYCFKKVKNGTIVCPNCNGRIEGIGQPFYQTYCEVKSDSGLRQDCDIDVYENGIAFYEPEHVNSMFMYKGIPGRPGGVLGYVGDSILNRNLGLTVGFMPFSDVINVTIDRNCVVRFELKNEEISYYQIVFRPDTAYDDIYKIIGLAIKDEAKIQKLISSAIAIRLNDPERKRLIEKYIYDMDNPIVKKELLKNKNDNYSNVYADKSMIAVKGFIIYRKFFSLRIIPMEKIEKIYAFRERRFISGSRSTAIFYFMRIVLNNGTEQIEFDGKYLENHAQFVVEVKKMMEE